MAFEVETLISEPEIQKRVRELGQQIAIDYRGKPLTIVAVLTGSLIVLADLVRRIEIPHRIALVQASSYKGATTTATTLVINESFAPDVVDRDVLLLDDILDTGLTLSALVRHIAARGAGASAPLSSYARSAARRSRWSQTTAASRSPTSSSSATDWILMTITGTCLCRRASGWGQWRVASGKKTLATRDPAVETRPGDAPLSSADRRG